MDEEALFSVFHFSFFTTSPSFAAKQQRRHFAALCLPPALPPLPPPRVPAVAFAFFLSKVTQICAGSPPDSNYVRVASGEKTTDTKRNEEARRHRDVMAVRLRACLHVCVCLRANSQKKIPQ